MSDLEEKFEKILDRVGELEKEKRQLTEKVRRLESNNPKKPKDRKPEISRRSFLKKAGAGALGLSAVGITSVSGMKLTKNSIFTGTGSNISGDTGKMDNLQAKQIAGDRHYAGAYDGSNPDERLDAALNEASEGATIHLESGVYTTNRTINTTYRWLGASTHWDKGSRINADWTFGTNSSDMVMTTVHIDGSITVEGDRSAFTHIRGGTLTFASGSTSNVADICMGTNVTDKDGSNSVGQTTS